jgi:hypothetical protein
MAQYKQPIPTAEDALRDAEKWNAGWDTFLKHPEAAKPRWKDEQSKIAARLIQRLALCSCLSCTEAEPPHESVKFSRCGPSVYRGT